MCYTSWIGLDMLYKLMERFFQMLESFFELTTIKKNSSVGSMHARRMRHLCSSARVLLNFEFLFETINLCQIFIEFCKLDIIL